MDFSKEKKLMADQWHVSVGNGFGIGFTTGAETHAFVMGVDAMKAMAIHLTKLVTQHEAEHGEIDVTNAPVVQMSPIQRKQ